MAFLELKLQAVPEFAANLSAASHKFGRVQRGLVVQPTKLAETVHQLLLDQGVTLAVADPQGLLASSLIAWQRSAYFREGVGLIMAK